MRELLAGIASIFDGIGSLFGQNNNPIPWDTTKTPQQLDAEAFEKDKEAIHNDWNLENL